MRTSGQSDRRLRVLNVSNFADGDSIADVQDVDTGQKFAIPGRMLAQLKRTTPTVASNPTPTPTAPSVVQAPPVRPLQTPIQTIPATPVAVRSPPVAAPPAAVPLPTPTRPAATTWRATSDPVVVSPQPAPATVPAVATTPAPTRRDVWSTATPWTSTDTKPVSTLPAVAPQTLPSATTPGFQPKLPNGPVSALPSNGPVVRGQAPDPTHGFVHLKPQVDEERQPIEPVGYTRVPTRQSIEQQLMEETKQHVYDLYTAVRPSLREGAATALAEGRFASRPEVKQVLAKAALADPAPAVRAHCIRLLSALGYHDPEYVEYLRACERGGNAAVRVAAMIALTRLAPR
jgi:hypothetical protein